VIEIVDEGSTTLQQSRALFEDQVFSDDVRQNDLAHDEIERAGIESPEILGVGEVNDRRGIRSPKDTQGNDASPGVRIHEPVEVRDHGPARMIDALEFDRGSEALQQIENQATFSASDLEQTDAPDAEEPPLDSNGERIDARGAQDAIEPREPATVVLVVTTRSRRSHLARDVTRVDNTLKRKEPGARTPGPVTMNAKDYGVQVDVSALKF